MREQDETPASEARSHSAGFLKKAERMAEKRGKGERGSKRRAKSRRRGR